MMNKPEILAPAGSMEALRAAVGAGADAVYLGGNRFGARAYAHNFDEHTLIAAIEYCHLYGVKVYLTVNTLFRNEEIYELYDYLEPFYLAGLDAVIVQDFGVLEYIHKFFPDLPIHGSTQMNITTPYAYEFLKDYGVTRVVPGRELSNEELFAMKQVDNPPELEVFVQGALCYCYSGQCLMSSFLGGRSGNRGRCAQPCRLPYQVYDEHGNLLETEGAYLLSPKDLSGLENIDKLIEMGIDSFKIEGRMKKPEYVAACVRAYRRVVDACHDNCLSQELINRCIKDMASVFNRGGFTKGYYEKHNGSDMMSMKQPGNAGVYIGKVISKNKKQIQMIPEETVHKGDLLNLKGTAYTIQLTCNVDSPSKKPIWLNASKLKEIKPGDALYRVQDSSLENELKTLICQDKKIPLKGRLSLVTGEPALFELECGSCSVCQRGKLVEPASKQPITESLVREKISQLGNTRYELKTLELFVSEDGFYSMKDLKELRRGVIKCLKEEILSSFRRQKNNEKPVEAKQKKEINNVSNVTWESPVVEISTFEQFDALKSYENMKDIYLDLQYFSNKDIIELSAANPDYNFWIVLPAVFRKEAYADVEYVTSVNLKNLRGIVVRNIDEYAYFRLISYGKEIVADDSLYVMNSYAGDFLGETVTISVELNESQIRRLSPSLEKKQVCVYGYEQLMVSAQCVCNHTLGCKKNNPFLILKDRYHKDFYVKSVCKYCYSLIYNGLPTVLYDLDSDCLQSGGIRHLLHFTMETKEQMTRVLDSYISGNLYEGERTKGHFSRGVE